MARLPPKAREELTTEQQELHDNFLGVAERSFGDMFVYKDAKGAFIGPFPFFLADPAAGTTIVQLIGHLSKLPLPPDAREVAILTVGAHFKAGYETYSHTPQAANTGQLTLQQAQVLASGGEPEGLTEDCKLAFDVAKYLCGTPGPLPRELWEKAVGAFGRDGMVALLHYIGFYCYISVALNGVDAEVPEP